MQKTSSITENQSKINTGTLKKATISYGLRQVLTTAVAIIANIVLTRLLLPKEYGIIAIITLVMSLGTVIADGGLGIYLIQRKEAVTDREISEIANFQMAVALLFSMFLLLGTWVAHASGYDTTVIWLLAITSVSIPLTIIRGVSLLRLERVVQMDKIAVVDVLEQIVYAGTAIVAAYSGLGVWSIVFGILARALVGCLIALWLAPWSYRFIFPTFTQEFIAGMKYAFHYQGAQFINIARTSINPLFIISVLGLKNGGYVERANYVNGAPIGLISAIQNKVFFPFSSRIQDDKAKLKRFLEDSIYVNSVLDKAFYLPLFLFTQEIVHLVFTDKWLPIIPLLKWLIGGTMVFGSLSGPLYPVINAIGASQVIFRFNLVTMVITWILVVPLCFRYGIQGVGIGSIIIWTGVWWLKRELAGRIGSFCFFSQTLRPNIAAGVIIVLTQIIVSVTKKVPHSLFEVLVVSLCVVICYLGVLFIVDPVKTRQMAQKIIAA